MFEEEGTAVSPLNKSADSSNSYLNDTSLSLVSNEEEIVTFKPRLGVNGAPKQVKVKEISHLTDNSTNPLTSKPKGVLQTGGDENEAIVLSQCTLSKAAEVIPQSMPTRGALIHIILLLATSQVLILTVMYKTS